MQGQTWKWYYIAGCNSYAIYVLSTETGSVVLSSPKFPGVYLVTSCQRQTRRNDIEPTSFAILRPRSASSQLYQMQN